MADVRRCAELASRFRSRSKCRRISLRRSILRWRRIARMASACESGTPRRDQLQKRRVTHARVLHVGERSAGQDGLALRAVARHFQNCRVGNSREAHGLEFASLSPTDSGSPARRRCRRSMRARINPAIASPASKGWLRRAEYLEQRDAVASESPRLRALWPVRATSRA